MFCSKVQVISIHTFTDVIPGWYGGFVCFFIVIVIGNFFMGYMMLLWFAQERTYFIDYIKNHNASMMRDISEMRSSIMRRNAHLVDWLVDNVGPLKMQLIHKKPAVSGCSTPIAPSSITPSDRGHGTSLVGSQRYEFLIFFVSILGAFVYVFFTTQMFLCIPNLLT